METVTIYGRTDRRTTVKNNMHPICRCGGLKLEPEVEEMLGDKDVLNLIFEAQLLH